MGGREQEDIMSRQRPVFQYQWTDTYQSHGKPWLASHCCEASSVTRCQIVVPKGKKASITSEGPFQGPTPFRLALKHGQLSSRCYGRDASSSSLQVQSNDGFVRCRVCRRCCTVT